ncbi:hypothetical protein GEV33_003861 [Tenebrio molitor]|uniref:Uncharacterized protein n=1 Tax=Tenebrio molitor TaxID=7067 RepID=A0A8J6LEZ4_TENMO|nr:hypothetical protein GEV33_003861 [Tenebrio molitor]
MLFSWSNKKIETLATLHEDQRGADYLNRVHRIRPGTRVSSGRQYPDSALNRAPPPPQPRVYGRAQPPSPQKDRAEPAERILIPIPIPIPIINPTLLAPVLNRLPIQPPPPTPLPTPDFPFAPLVSEPGHPLFPARSLPYERTRPPPIPPTGSRYTPATPLHPDPLSRSLALSTPPRGSSRADQRKYEHTLISLATVDIPQVDLRQLDAVAATSFRASSFRCPIDVTPRKLPNRTKLLANYLVCSVALALVLFK